MKTEQKFIDISLLLVKEKEYMMEKNQFTSCVHNEVKNTIKKNLYLTVPVTSTRLHLFQSRFL